MRKSFGFVMCVLFLLAIVNTSNSSAEGPSYEFQDDIKINDTENNSRGSPKIAVYQDNVYITWFDNRNNNNISDTYFSRSLDGGGNFSANRRIGNQTGGFRSFEVGPTGTLYGTYVYYGSIFFMKSSNEGDTFSEPIKVNDPISDGKCAFPRMAIDNENNVFIVWDDERNDIPSDMIDNHDIYFARSMNAGNSFEKNIRVNDDVSTTTQWEPDIDVGPNGNIYVVWTDSRNDQPGGSVDWDIYFSKSTDNGVSFDKNVPVSHDETYSAQSSPKITVEDDENIYVVWGDRRPGPGDESGNYKVYFSRSTDGGLSFEPDIFIRGGPPGASIEANDKEIFIIYSFGAAYLVISEDKGNTFNAPIYLTPWETYPRMALDEQSNIYLTWGEIYFKKGIRIESSNDNSNNGKKGKSNENELDFWIWIIGLLVLIVLITVIARKRSKSINE